MFFLLLLTTTLVLCVGVDTEEQKSVHGRWTLVADKRAAERVTLHVLLKHAPGVVAQLERAVRAVSDPASSAYGQHLTQSALTALLAPPASSQRAVAAWLASALNASDIAFVAHRDALTCVVSSAAAEREFGVRFGVWRNELGREITRSRRSHVVPKHVEPHIDIILGLSDFPMLRRKGQPLVRAASPNNNNNNNNTTTLPTISLVYSRATSQIDVVVDVRCVDGSMPVSLPACAASDALQSLVVGAAVPYGPSATALRSSAFECRAPTAPGDGVTCVAHITSASYYSFLVNITATLQFASGATLSTTSAFPAVTTPPVLPQTLRKLYGIPEGASVLAGATQAVAEFEQQYYSDADLRQFFRAVGLPESNADLVTVIGPNNQSHAGGEAALDIEYIMALANGADTTFWSIAANSSIEIDDIVKWAVAMSNSADPPMVTSISYGMSENLVDTYLGKGYLARSDVEFAKLAARGLTVVIASGDTGAGDLGPLPMSNPTCKTLHPDWPSQSPYVLSIGSTYITPLAEPICYGTADCTTNALGEVAVSMDQGLFWTTGGGFSNRIKTPWYQIPHVQSYLQSGAKFPPSAAFNESGRAYNDAVAVGHNLMVALRGAFQPVDGTSASAPIYAGVLTLLNDHRLRNGKSPLGFFNPALYALALKRPSTIANDITVGNNRCGAYPGGDFPQSSECCAWGYEATAGFDAVGGLGSPWFPSLLEEVLKLP